MDNGILKKRLNTFKSGESGQLRGVADEVVLDVLRAWENWPGTAADLYRELGLSKMQLVTMIQKAKRLVKSGVVVSSEFQEIGVAAGVVSPSVSDPCQGVELVWDASKVIRFPHVDQLVEFLKKVA